MSYFLGIDPGKSGGAAVITDTGFVIADVGFSKASERDIADAFASWGRYRQSKAPDAIAVIEHVKGRGGWSATANFSFGESSGGLRMLLLANHIRFERVVPTIWQRALGMKKQKGEARSDYKRRLKARAQELFPNVRVTNATADALLIAEFARRLETRS